MLKSDLLPQPRQLPDFLSVLLTVSLPPAMVGRMRLLEYASDYEDGLIFGDYLLVGLELC